MTEEHALDWYTDDNATFGDRIAVAREMRGMSAENLAQKLGVALQTVEHWENNVSEPRANKVQMLSGVLHVSMRWLLTGEGENVEMPTEGDGDIAAALDELRELRADLARTMERLSAVERILRGETLAAAE